MIKISKLRYLAYISIDTRQIDKLLKQIDADYSLEIEMREIDFDTDSYWEISQKLKRQAQPTSLLEVMNLSFSMYALAIVHCYSIFECNRAWILNNLPESNRKIEKNEKGKTVIKTANTSLNEDVEKVLLKNNIELSSDEVADEFRLVNNAIKHARFNYSHTVTIRDKEQTEYDFEKLRNLYLSHKTLNDYLADLYKNVKKINGLLQTIT